MKGNHTSLTLNQKPEMIQLCEQGMSKVKTGWKLGFLHQLATLQRKKFLKEIEHVTPVNTWMVRQWKSLTVDMGKVLMV